jgi:hypothetical protein
VLSPDFRGCAPVADRSSLDRPPGVGVVVDVRFGDLVPTPAVPVDLREGVEGRLAGLCVARLPSSARRSCSDCADAEICFVAALDGFVLVGFEAGPSVPRSSNCARSSSSVGAGFGFLEAMILQSMSATSSNYFEPCVRCVLALLLPAVVARDPAKNAQGKLCCCTFLSSAKCSTSCL